MKEEEERNQVARVFENMGADKESAQRMAGQLIKRAEQKAYRDGTHAEVDPASFNALPKQQRVELLVPRRLLLLLVLHEAPQAALIVALLLLLGGLIIK